MVIDEIETGPARAELRPPPELLPDQPDEPGRGVSPLAPGTGVPLSSLERPPRSVSGAATGPTEKPGAVQVARSRQTSKAPAPRLW